MNDYFKPLRRKVGVMTLLLECTFAAGWVRSLKIEDNILVPHPSPIGAVCSSLDGLLIVGIIGDTDSPRCPQRTSWRSLPHHCTLDELVSRASMKPIYWEAYGFGGGQIFSFTSHFPVVFIPY